MLRTRHAGLWVLLLVLLAACGRPETLPPLPEDGVILAFGDSLTYGTGAPGGESYPEQLQALTGRTVIRAGVPGERSAEGRQRLPGALNEHQPDLLILMHGGNDILRRESMDRLRANMAAMIEEAQRREVPVLLVGVPEPALPPRPPALYRDLAETYGLAYEGRVIGHILRDSGLRADGVHPNAEGYRKMARAFEEALREAGAL
ncbi:arylesterase [Alkalilimnicola ehrlichii]|uniref:arylesterase n=1 Tax=Alkalilimnicola ehrlichii TaxID=351052 RepID=UPI003BA3935A